MPQARLTDFGADPLWGFDEYGPTMDRPLPESEVYPTWKRRAIAAGIDVRGNAEARVHGGLPDYHIDDRADRPIRLERHREQMAKIDSRGDLPKR